MGVQTFKIIRQRLGWTAYKMSKALGISQSQYAYLETKAKSCKTSTLVLLQRIAEKEGIKGQEIWDLLRREPLD